MDEVSKTIAKKMKAMDIDLKFIKPKSRPTTGGKKLTALAKFANKSDDD